MKCYIVVATKGRAPQTRVLLDFLASQTLKPEGVVLVGVGPEDLEGCAEHPRAEQLGLETHYAPIGATYQRNAGLEAVSQAAAAAGVAREDWFVIFFDDDFRPASDWLEACAAAYEYDPELQGVTGLVLADGVTRGGVSETDALAYLSGKLEPVRPLPPGSGRKPLKSLYGCNMSFRGTVAAVERFDERLPLYAWQEDVDYSARVLRHGGLILEPRCRGVHLGVSGGRGSGLRLGYSQIANPLYLTRKRTMPPLRTLTLMSRSIASNFLRTLSLRRDIDYPGRMRGNALAFVDLLQGRCRPARILEL